MKITQSGNLAETTLSSHHLHCYLLFYPTNLSVNQPIGVSGEYAHVLSYHTSRKNSLENKVIPPKNCCQCAVDKNFWNFYQSHSYGCTSATEIIDPRIWRWHTPTII